MKRTLEALADGTFDLLVLGGGITGAGVALDATLRGLRVALIDRGDFASGTSSVSSKLVHGGLRYLEHGGFHLVYEALHERRLLLQNAPHLVRPLRFILPYYTGSRMPPWKWRTGLALYDLLAGRSNIRRSRPLALAQVRREFPSLRPQGLSGAAEYYDAQMDDARLCLEVVQTAARHGAVVANYVEALAFEHQEGKVTGIRAVDRLGGGEWTTRATQILNATGPWADRVCRLAGDDSGPRLQPTKGVHVIVPDRGLKAAFLFLHPVDGRVFFVIPWMGKTLIGTTDTLADEPPEALHVHPQEIAYLIEGNNHYFTTTVETHEVMGTFAGLRPLLQGRTDKPSSISREFHLFRSASGLLTAAGGKYTTYRRMAEVITDAVTPRPCHTHRQLLDGAPEQPWPSFFPQQTALLRVRHSLREEDASHLVQRYGRHAAEVAAGLDSQPALGRRIVPGEPDLQVELAYQQQREMAMTPADSLLRRTRLGLFYPSLLQAPGV